MDYTGSIYRLIDRAEDEMKEYGRWDQVQELRKMPTNRMN